MGKSGSGKSTLMHCAAGLDDATAGHVFLGDVDLTALKEKHLTELRRDRIGFVFQAFNLVPTLTARENIVLPSAIAGRRPDPAWFDEVVDTVGLRDRLGHRPSELSGGQQQRVACARALVGRPDIVFADEPTGNLDSTSGAEVLGFLRRVVDTHGQTVVMVTHDPGAASWTDRVVFLADGRVVDELRAPTPERVLARDGRPRPPRRGLIVLRATWRSLFARKLRLFLSAFAVILGVAFVSGSLRLHRHPRPRLHRADQRRGGRRHRAPGDVGRQRRRLRRRHRPGPAPCRRPWSTSSPPCPGRRAPTAGSRTSAPSSSARTAS